MGRTLDGSSSETMGMLTRYVWRGNIRELQNVIERSIVLHQRGSLSVKKTWLSQGPFHNLPATRPSLRRSAAEDRRMIDTALAEAEGLFSGPLCAAALLGIPPSTLEPRLT